MSSLTSRFVFSYNEWSKAVPRGESAREPKHFVAATEGRVRPSQLSNWRSGKERPNQDNARLSAEILGVSFAWLYIGEGEAPEGFTEWLARQSRGLPAIQIIPTAGERELRRSAVRLREKAKTPKRHQR